MEVFKLLLTLWHKSLASIFLFLLWTRIFHNPCSPQKIVFLNIYPGSQISKYFIVVCSRQHSRNLLWNSALDFTTVLLEPQLFVPTLSNSLSLSQSLVVPLVSLKNTGSIRHRSCSSWSNSLKIDIINLENNTDTYSIF